MAKTKKVRSHEVTFEGKNIHFSPLDNKPLCSFSNKLCRQRRLNGYAFCIRHILEDKSSPFKQCDFVTRNNGQRCLNAIPSNQERGYCHSHMQVAGIIPKTERKVKLGASNQSAGTGKDCDSKKENKKKASIRTESTTTTESSATSSKPTKRKKPSTPSTKTKGKSIPPMTIDPTNITEKDLGDLPDNRCDHINGKAQIEALPRKHTRSSTQLNDQVGKKGAKQMPSMKAVPPTQLKQESFDSVNGDVSLDLDFQYAQQKTLNISDYSSAVPIIDAKLVKDELLHLDIPIMSLGGTDEFVLNPPFLKLQRKSDVLFSNIDDNRKLGNGKCHETRQEFLSRVRSAFKSHYKMFRRAYKLNENHEEGNKPFRESLLSCVLADPRMSAKMLTNSQIGKSKAESSNRMGEKNNQAMPVNFQSNKNKIPVSASAHDGVGYLSSSFLRDFDENLSSEQLKESKFCDSSPWMNDGIQDLQLGNTKKAKLVNQTSKAYSDGGKIPARKNQRTATNVNSGLSENSKGRSNSSYQHSGLGMRNGTEVSHSARKRRIDLDNDLDELEHNLGLGLDDATSVNENHLLGPSHYCSVAQFETVLTSVSSSETTGTPDGVITDASFDSPFNHSTSSQPDCDFSDDVDLEKTFELQIDPEIAHQASRLLENNELTEDDFNELFPETRSITDHKLSGDLGIDFTTTFDADIDYTLFANIFPNFRSNNSSEVISVTQNF